jgi:carboxylesterase
MPVLRGHGTHYTALHGVTALDWYDDAEAALLELSREVDKVVVVGLSMGGLVAINLGIRHPDKIAGVVTLAAALRFKDPTTRLSPLLAKVVADWPSPNSFNKAPLKSECANYPRFATDAFLSLLTYSQETELRLKQLHTPVCVLQSKKDQVVDPVSANLIYRDVSSTHRESHWFTRTGHEMGQDLEKDDVFKRVMGYVEKFRKNGTQ